MASTPRPPPSPSRTPGWPMKTPASPALPPTCGWAISLDCPGPMAISTWSWTSLRCMPTPRTCSARRWWKLRVCSNRAPCSTASCGARTALATAWAGRSSPEPLTRSSKGRAVAWVSPISSPARRSTRCSAAAFRPRPSIGSSAAMSARTSRSRNSTASSPGPGADMPRVCFVTLSRSDYASLRPVALAALADPAIDLRLIAGGSHALARYGNTLEQIRQDGLPLRDVARFLRATDDRPSELAAAYARAVTQFARILGRQQPDYVFVIGDRWEMLAVVSAASMLQIPIVHHSGGDITQGSADNQTRYALSALSHLHLVALPEHRERLLRMGEQDWRVITTGEPALTALTALAAQARLRPDTHGPLPLTPRPPPAPLAEQARLRPDVEGRLGLTPGEPFVLATFHPTSFDAAPPERQVEVFLQALDGIRSAIVLTAPNPDPASALFLARYRAYADAHPRVRLHHSLGTQHYYAAMAQAQYMIGNSSSGIWESASLRLPVVDIGPRQQDRVHGNNVLHCALEPQAIAAAIARATDPALRASLDGKNPYVRPDTLALIVDSLKHPWDRARLLAKRFVDPLARH